MEDTRDMHDTDKIVRSKLADAGLTLSDREVARYVAGYETQRNAVNSLYALDLAEVEPVITFNPTKV